MDDQAKGTERLTNHSCGNVKEDGARTGPVNFLTLRPTTLMIDTASSSNIVTTARIKGTATQKTAIKCSIEGRHSAFLSAVYRFLFSHHYLGINSPAWRLWGSDVQCCALVLILDTKCFISCMYYFPRVKEICPNLDITFFLLRHSP
jgi:hypothetical protein